MPAATLSDFSGRAASLERRRALSQGKSALPPATERVRTGDRSAALPRGAAAQPPAAPNWAAASSTPAPLGASPEPAFTVSSQSGRNLSMMRRRQLSGGKRMLQAAISALPSVTSDSKAPAVSLGGMVTATPSPASVTNGRGSGREQARMRRALLSERGRGDGPAAPPTRPPRQGMLQYAPKVTESPTHGGQVVTGSRIGRGTKVTGDEPGSMLPVSGTQYIGASDGQPVRPGGVKVGLARTAGGGIVSGTLIRSKVRVTGDEAGRTIITGEAEQSDEDDLTPRASESAPVAAQFNRQANPHGHSVFGTNLGKFASTVGSRERTRGAPIESTENGLGITGSAVGRGGRVTGDEAGTCRQVTGNQYLTPARTECGGATAPSARAGAMRRDPVTGGKVSISQTWGQQRLTGTNVEHDPRVTGEAAGSCSIITGSPYQGTSTVHGWCDADVASAAEERLVVRPALSAITGDVPQHTDTVTGTGRGADRQVTGSAYYRAEVQGSDAGDAPAAIDARFSISSPQRTAQLRARAAKQTASDSEAGREGVVSVISTSPPITGSFAVRSDRVTGNAEFHFKPRSLIDANAAAARLRLTGEGRAEGARVTGGSWSEQSNVTGTEGYIAAERNPSERSGRPQCFSGARRFKTLAKTEDSKQLVTGLSGWSGKTAARVTLSGGAQA